MSGRTRRTQRAGVYQPDLAVALVPLAMCMPVTDIRKLPAKDQLIEQLRAIAVRSDEILPTLDGHLYLAMREINAALPCRFLQPVSVLVHIARNRIGRDPRGGKQLNAFRRAKVAAVNHRVNPAPSQDFERRF